MLGFKYLPLYKQENACL